MEPQVTDRVEIYVDEKNNTKKTAYNNVAIVVPSATIISSEASGQEVTFSNQSNAEVTIWFPEQWYQPNDVKNNAVGPLVNLSKKGEEITLIVDHTKATTGKIKQYQVFAQQIREFGVGDSPPTMVFKP